FFPCIRMHEIHATAHVLHPGWIEISADYGGIVMANATGKSIHFCQIRISTEKIWRGLKISGTFGGEKGDANAPCSHRPCNFAIQKGEAIGTVEGPFEPPDNVGVLFQQRNRFKLAQFKPLRSLPETFA